MAEGPDASCRVGILVALRSRIRLLCPSALEPGHPPSGWSATNGEEPLSLELKLLKQFTLFTGVGAIGTAGHYAVLIVMTSGFGVDAVAASAVGSVVGAIVNYLLNYK